MSGSAPATPCSPSARFFASGPFVPGLRRGTPPVGAEVELSAVGVESSSLVGAAAGAALRPFAAGLPSALAADLVVVGVVVLEDVGSVDSAVVVVVVVDAALVVAPRGGRDDFAPSPSLDSAAPSAWTFALVVDVFAEVSFAAVSECALDLCGWAVVVVAAGSFPCFAPLFFNLASFC